MISNCCAFAHADQGIRSQMVRLLAHIECKNSIDQSNENWNGSNKKQSFIKTLSAIHCIIKCYKKNNETCRNVPF